MCVFFYFVVISKEKIYAFFERSEEILNFKERRAEKES